MFVVVFSLVMIHPGEVMNNPPVETTLFQTTTLFS